ncbi:uncharacterized protein PAC_14997 [Phialocephala subalpina]|uniref:Bacteriophage T5 Orf172 DNA-binding domain-containing protein n=1 Tax=Phialocephala subalpina TaxID=576137 RepID=A0A1L7XJG1_9HELO|nr:uncharacterized protein PAC_14997 [Phialocephala subalpina]
MFGTPQGDSESHHGQSPTAHPFSMNQKSGCNHRAFDRPPLKTPFRLKCATASSTSSSSSSSTASSIFDEGLTRAGTPLTPPISETPDSSNAGRSRLSSHGKLSTSSFVERCVDTSNLPSSTPATASTAKRPSQYLSDSDYELLVEGVKKLGVQDDEQDDEQASNTRASLGLDKSPAPAGRPQLKKRSRQSVQGDDDYSQSPMKNGVSNRKNRHRNTSRTDETPLAEPKVQRAQNLAGARSTPRSSKRKSAETPSLVITQIDSEGKEVDADSSGATAQNLPRPIQYRQKATLSAPRASHKRSASAPGPDNKSNIITQDTPIASTNSKNASPTQTNEVDATAPLAPTRCSSRRRSTGSVVPEHTVLPSIECPSPGDDEGVPGAFPNEPINVSEVSRQSPSSEPPERTPDLHPDETRKSPKLEYMHPKEKNKNDLKNEILRTIRRQKSKPAAASTLKYGYVYIFKSDRFKGHVKIGSTVKAPDTRIKEWSTTCNFKTIQVTDKNDRAFRFCRIVEQIVHAELYNQQKRFYCDRCKMKHRFTMAERAKGTGETELDVRPTEHGEWFEISETKALEVVNKWRDWMIHQEPYKEDATLRSCWVWKYDMGTKWMKGTEAEWEVWRQFGWLDTFGLILYGLNKWLGEVSPLLQKLVNSPGSVFVLAAGFYLGTVGVNLTSCLTVAIVLLLYQYMCFKFC